MESGDYHPEISESNWQKKWEEAEIFVSKVDSNKSKFYCLEMYPYPSGKMHMGHVRNYSIGDAVARYKRAQGFNVIYPMGFDSFGMPAENAAIAENKHPREITERNISSITKQIKRMGFSYDWNRQVKSHDENYYKWNQLFFLKFLENGLVYRDFAPVNWCNDCSTVLANEQVKNGRCWRCSEEVKQKDMSQWFLKITDYSQDLLDDLEIIDFPEKVKLLQQDWLGRSEGALIKFQIENTESFIEAFTTRPDTIFGVTFVTLAPEHPLCEELVLGTEYENEWKELRDEAIRMSDFDREKVLKDKKGVFLGKYAINPISGEKVPIYAGNFVLYGYGTGAVMAVPAHDQRDFEFAKRYGIDIKQVLVKNKEEKESENLTAAFTGLGWMINSTESGFDGTFGDDAKNLVIKKLEMQKSGKGMVQWKIRPWLISRQRYWGTPIPIIHCESCGVVPVPEDQLPVLLPDDVEFTGKGNPLETSVTFTNVKCPKCGEDARRETDTMDTFVDSSWYFLRFSDANNFEKAFDKEIVNYWMNVDFYCGGIEHAQMHLIYARFWTKALRDLGMHDIDEPFQRLLCQGMVNKPAPYCSPCNVTFNVKFYGLNCPTCGVKLGERSAKMSKSLGNTVSPEAMVEKYGADTVRLFMLFAAQPEAEMEWSDLGVHSAWKQINQLYKIPETILQWSGEAKPIDNWLIASAKQRYSEWENSMDEVNLRAAVQITHYDMITDLNWYLRRGGSNIEVGRKLLEIWTPMLQIATPHLSEEWWHMLGKETLLAAHEIENVNFELSSNELLILSEEEYLKSFLEQARNVRQMAIKHMKQKPNEIIIQTSEIWKNKMAKIGLEVQISGEKINTAFSIIQQQEFWNDDRIRGEASQLWKKKMLGQLFKWKTIQKQMILSDLDENKVLQNAAEFISDELELQIIHVLRAGEGEEELSKSKFAFPLEPGVIFR
ncbi:MAG: Leucine--tRNA ligase subunit alpha [Methanobacteriota archaeon]|nr:MAG: Leucine--tRNA ligase subunit alpha [Euryarchaeota archaeon]